MEKWSEIEIAVENLKELLDNLYKNGQNIKNTK